MLMQNRWLLLVSESVEMLCREYLGCLRIKTGSSCDLSDLQSPLPVRCLSPDADLRPDIVAVSARISDLMMRLMDDLHTHHRSLERRAERDRKRAQKYFLEWHRGRTWCPPEVQKHYSSTAKHSLHRMLC